MEMTEWEWPVSPALCGMAETEGLLEFLGYQSSCRSDKRS